METPLVSVVLPTYNRASLLERAVASVFAQTYRNIEVVIVDDCSSDNTPEVVSTLVARYGRVTAVRNEKNQGMVRTLNRGVAEAKGKYIARIDDDDTWIDQKKIEKQVEFLEEHPEFVLVGGGVVKVDSSGKETMRYLLPKKDIEIRKIILSSNVFIHSSVLFPKAVFQEVGGYNEKFGFFADWELWLRLGTRGKLFNMQEYFVKYLDNEDRTVGNSHDVQIRRRLREAIQMKTMYKEYYLRYSRAITFAVLSYVYSFLPFRKSFARAMFKVRRAFIGLSHG